MSEDQLAKVKKVLEELGHAKTGKIVFKAVGKALTVLQLAELVYSYYQKKHGKWTKSQEVDFYADVTLFAIGMLGLPGAIFSMELGLFYRKYTNWLENEGAKQIKEATFDFLNLSSGDYFDFRDVISNF